MAINTLIPKMETSIKTCIGKLIQTYAIRQQHPGMAHTDALQEL